MKLTLFGFFVIFAIPGTGFYSTHHQSIFTHHRKFMRVHLLDKKSLTVGDLDELLASAR